MFSRIQAIDTAIFDWVKAHPFPLVSYAARDLTSLGGNVCVFAVTVYVTVLNILNGSSRLAWFFAGGIAFTAAFITTLKLLICRPCPLQPDPYQIRCCDHGGFPVPHLPCMPSGHTTASTVLYGFLGAMYPEFFWVGIGLPIAIGITRVILSAHWASDVVVGFGLGHVILAVWRLLL